MCVLSFFPKCKRFQKIIVYQKIKLSHKIDLLFRRKRKRRDQDSVLGSKGTTDKPLNFNLPQIPPPLPLLNASTYSLAAHPGSSFSAIHQEQNYSSDLQKQTTSEKKVGEGVELMPVKAELQRQPGKLLETTHKFASKEPEHSQASMSRMGTNGTIMDACSRYGITGCFSASAVNGAANDHETGMPLSQHGYNQSLNGNLTTHSSSAQGHCVSTAFNFSVSNLIHRNFSEG